MASLTDGPWLLGLDPRFRDSDGDGFDDATRVLYGSNLWILIVCLTSQIAPQLLTRRQTIPSSPGHS